MTAINVYAKNNRLSYTKEELDTKTCTLSIVSTPADATIKIDDIITSTKTVDYGTTVNYEVSKNAFATETGTLKICRDTILNVEMVSTEEELDWIQLTGTQYINNIQHEIPLNSTIEIKVNIGAKEGVALGGKVFQGVSNDDNTFTKSLSFSQYYLYLTYSLYTETTNSKKLETRDNTLDRGSDIIIKYKNFKVYKNNSELTTYITTASPQYDKVCNSYSILSTYNKAEFFATNKFYWLKIYNGNTDEIIHYYIPILDAKGVVKIKDIITNEIYEFNGTNINDITYGRKSS